MRDRQRLARVDNEHLHFDIELIRKKIFEGGISVNNAGIERILAEKSLTATRVSPILLSLLYKLMDLQSAFSQRLFQHGFNFYALFVPNFLHEFELGVWKSIFTHLMRILHAHGNDAIAVVNSR